MIIIGRGLNENKEAGFIPLLYFIMIGFVMIFENQIRLNPSDPRHPCSISFRLSLLTIRR